ncbi:MAG TPA: sulfate adenylyltransferase subunit CysN [Azospirillaceae bacterium]|nr:sulfate adenylyltransferase subunit CysN [Azospirillaceae bacterium]
MAVPDQPTDLLRFITCGSVDDGKSTLIGRLLYESELVLDDHLSALEKDSRRFGTTGAGALDLALLVDGLSAEREQGITIDVAYRYFATATRKFIVADTPGHEQYTRNMATGASTAEAAVLLVDARKSLLVQTRRHSFIASLLGIRHVAVAVNKMDAVGWERSIFDRIAAEYAAFATRLGFEEIICIPVSALTGDNVVRPSDNLAWYEGPTLMRWLETVEPSRGRADRPFRMPVQWVCRPSQDFRGFAGTVVAGSVRPGDPVAVLPSGVTTSVARIVTMDGDLREAQAEDAVTLVLSDEVDLARGDVIAAAGARPEVSDQFAAHLVWLGEAPLLPGRPYLIRFGPTAAVAQVMTLKHSISVNTMEPIAAQQLAMNDIGVCTLSLDRPVPFEPYATNRDLGGFILIDRQSNATVACGMIDFALRRAANIHRQALKVDKAARAAANRQKPCVLWFTGLSGAGKSTLADLVEQDLHRRGYRTMILDGDNVRHGLNRDLGFTDADRVENIRRVAEVAKLMVEAGLIVLVSFISPFRSERQMARELLEEGEFVEIYVDAPLEVCEARDPKGLYRKARAGQLPNFTGIDSAYEPPLAAELVVPAAEAPPEELADRILRYLEERGVA